MSELGPTSLTNVLWSFARLRYQPSEEWENAAAEQVRPMSADGRVLRQAFCADAHR